MAASRPRTSPRPRRASVTTSEVLAPSLLVSRIAPRVSAVSGSSPRMLRAVTVLPLPLSPTMASTSPACTCSVTPVTASTVPASVAKEICRSLMSTTVLIARLPARSAPRSLALPAMLARASASRRSQPEPSGLLVAGDHGAARLDDTGRRRTVAGPPAAAQPRVGEVVEALADQGQAEHGEHDRDAREDRRPPNAAGHVGQ